VLRDRVERHDLLPGLLPVVSPTRPRQRARWRARARSPARDCPAHARRCPRRSPTGGAAPVSAPSARQASCAYASRGVGHRAGTSLRPGDERDSGSGLWGSAFSVRRYFGARGSDCRL
jgi:hypothetical protein